MNLKIMKVFWLYFTNKLLIWENKIENFLIYRIDWEVLIIVIRNYWNWLNFVNRGCWMFCFFINFLTRLMVLKYG